MKNDRLDNINDMVELVHKMGKVLQPYSYFGRLDRFLTNDDKPNGFKNKHLYDVKNDK